MELGGVPEKFTGDLYSMYVVLKGIEGSLSCIRVYIILYIIYVIPFWGVATLDV